MVLSLSLSETQTDILKVIKHACVQLIYIYIEEHIVLFTHLFSFMCHSQIRQMFLFLEK